MEVLRDSLSRPRCECCYREHVSGPCSYLARVSSGGHSASTRAPSRSVAFCPEVNISCIMHQQVAYRGVCASSRCAGVLLACWEMGRRVWGSRRSICIWGWLLSALFVSARRRTGKELFSPELHLSSQSPFIAQHPQIDDLGRQQRRSVVGEAAHATMAHRGRSGLEIRRFHRRALATSLRLHIKIQ